MPWSESLPAAAHPTLVGATQKAAQLGAFTASISCNEGSEISGLVDEPIDVVCGPEVVAGSTRLKAGTAQKMVLNMISTATMIRLGNVYSNLMVNLNLSNRKLTRRGIRIVAEAANDLRWKRRRRHSKRREMSDRPIVMICTEVHGR